MSINSKISEIEKEIKILSEEKNLKKINDGHTEIKNKINDCKELLDAQFGNDVKNYDIIDISAEKFKENKHYIENFKENINDSDFFAKNYKQCLEKISECEKYLLAKKLNIYTIE